MLQKKKTREKYFLSQPLITSLYPVPTLLHRSVYSSHEPGQRRGKKIKVWRETLKHLKITWVGIWNQTYSWRTEGTDHDGGQRRSRVRKLSRSEIRLHLSWIDTHRHVCGRIKKHGEQRGWRIHFRGEKSEKSYIGNGNPLPPVRHEDYWIKDESLKVSLIKVGACSASPCTPFSEGNHSSAIR